MRISAEQFGVWCRTRDPNTCPTYDPFDMRLSSDKHVSDRLKEHVNRCAVCLFAIGFLAEDIKNPLAKRALHPPRFCDYGLKILIDLFDLFG